MSARTKYSLIVGIVIVVGAIVSALVYNGPGAKDKTIPLDKPRAEQRTAPTGDARGTPPAKPTLTPPPRSTAPATPPSATPPRTATPAPASTPALPPRITPDTTADAPHTTAEPASRPPLPTPGTSQPVATPPSAVSTPPLTRTPGESTTRPAISTPPITPPAVETPRIAPGTRPASNLPAATGTPPPGPVTPGRRYKIQEADTLAAIAREEYGDEKYWRAIQAANPAIDPNRLLVGQEIILPRKEDVVKGATATPPRTGDTATPAAPRTGLTATGEPRSAARTVTVARGDTLVALARKHLNDEHRWREIYELNKDKLSSPDNIREGMELKLPANGNSGPAADKPRATTRPAGGGRQPPRTRGG